MPGQQESVGSGQQPKPLMCTWLFVLWLMVTPVPLLNWIYTPTPEGVTLPFVKLRRTVGHVIITTVPVGVTAVWVNAPGMITDPGETTVPIFHKRKDVQSPRGFSFNQSEIAILGTLQHYARTENPPEIVGQNRKPPKLTLGHSQKFKTSVK